MLTFYKFVTSLIILLFSAQVAFADELYRELVLGEIQQTLIKDYGAKANFWGAETEVAQAAKVEEEQKVVPSKKLPEQIKKTILKKNEPAKLDSAEQAKKMSARTESKAKGLQESESEEEDVEVLGKRGRLDKKGGLRDADPNSKESVDRSRYKAKAINFPKSGAKESRSSSWADKKLREQGKWQDRTKKEQYRWEQRKKKMLQQWRNARRSYLKRIPQYKKALYSFSSFVSGDLGLNNEKPLKVKFKGNDGLVLVNSAFYDKVKDQGKRATCAAFAATRSLEIKLAQSGNPTRLSEQYFYYASKPDCQSSPCNKAGSWASAAFRGSKNSNTPDIPTQSACPYRAQPAHGNETQLPLPSGCFTGQHKVTQYRKIRSMSDIISSLDAGHPVVSAFKLSSSFYRNKGVVFAKDAKGVSKRKHASGHALLLVGYLKIPKQLGEGDYCLLVANSWGEGWGKGGHACLSEKWARQYRFDMPFLSLQAAR